MSKRINSRKTAHRRPLTRGRKQLNLYRRNLRYEPLEDRRLLAVVTVTTLGDTVNFSDGVTSLREAIFATNTVPGADTINFTPSLTAGGPATILLTQGELGITDALTIAGLGAGLLTIDASGNDATPAVKDGQGSRVFNVDNGTSVVIDVGISGLTLKGGDVTGDGGAISSSENLTVADSTISNSAASGRGGGVFSQTGTLLLSGSTLTGNSAKSGLVNTGGGGAVASLGNATIDHSTLSGNSAFRGGAIRAFGDLLVDHSTVSGNTAQVIGGGICSYDSSAAPHSVTIRDSLIANNVATSGEGGGVRQRFGSLLIERTTITGNKTIYGGGISAADGNINVQIVDSAITANVLTGFGGFGSALGYGGGVFLKTATASFVRSTISGNSGGMRGGGIYLQSGGLAVDSSTVSGNSAVLGGGIASSSYFTPAAATVITNSTISGNTASQGGGGIRNLSGLMSIRYSTITNNSAPEGAGSGIAIGAGLFTPTDVRSSIIAGNIHSDVSSVSPSAFTSLGYNVIGSGSHLDVFNKPGDQTGITNPMLGPLANNGGPTMTHALLAGSPAINEGDLSSVAGVNGVPTYDQRGTPFGRVFNGRIDIGAFEYQQASDLNLVVDTLVDESDGNYSRGDLSLREAIGLANIWPSTDTIHFDPSLTAGGPATIRLTNGELKIAGSLTINGPGANLLTIDASGSDPSPNVKEGNGSRAFDVDDGLPSLSLVSLNGMTITGADVKVDGGGIYSTESLAISNAQVMWNYARPSQSGSSSSTRGAGIFTTGPLSIENVVVAANYGNGYGAGIYAVENTAADITLKNSQINGNKSNGNGGGLYVAQLAPGNITIQDSVFAGNDAGFSGFSGNGGGVFINRQAAGNVSILDSSFQENGGYSYGTLYISVGQSATGNVSFEGTDFLSNRSKVVGQPSIYVEHNSVGNIEISNDTFTGNNLFNSSGMRFIHRGSGDIKVENSYVTGIGRSDNHTAGALWVSHSGSGNIYLSQNKIDDNLGRGAYVLHAGLGEVTIAGNEFARNDAGSLTGAGVYIRTGMKVASQVTNNTVLNNTGTSNLGNAGGISIQGTDGGAFVVENNVVTGNSGGINATVAGNLNVNGNLITDNTGTGLSVRGLSGAVIQLRSNVVSRNVSKLRGGGIALRTNQGASVTIADSTISGNVGDTSGGGLDADQYAGSFLEILRTTIDGNRLTANLTPGATAIGGGARIFDRGGSISLDQVTISGNQAARGGGVWISTVSAGDVAIRRSTITGNSATSALSSSANGGGVFVQAGLVLLDHTLVAQNADAAGGAPDAGRDAAALGIEVRYSLVGNDAGSGLLEAPVGVPDANGNLIGGPVHGVIDPLLGPLANNGGPTLTHALLEGSPAINAGDPAAAMGTGGVPLNDQRGVPFIRVYGGRIDIGSFESQPTDFVLGDFNHDGMVDSSDYTLFRKQVGQTVAPGTGADANGDGVVNNADYLVWQTNFGARQSQLPQSLVQSPAIGLSEPMSASPSGQQVALLQPGLGDDSKLPSITRHAMFSSGASEVRVRQRSRALWLADGPQYTNDARWSDLALEAWRAADRGDQLRFRASDLGRSRANDSASGSAESPAWLNSTIDTAFSTL